jgi:hypothetical protein
LAHILRTRFTSVSSIDASLPIFADLVPWILGKANGSFLWASLLLKYLQLPVFTPDERQRLIQNIDQLDSLDSLYQHILGTLESRQDEQKSTIASIFRWMSLSINRICKEGFQKAVLITPGQQTNDLPALSSFLDSIGPLTCGLAEVTQCSVVFAHRSVAEYLQSSACQNSSFNLFDESSSHAHLAAQCLSYLAYDVPKRPLSRLRPHIRSAPTSITTSSGTSMLTSISEDSGYKSMSSASGSDGLLSPTYTPASLAPSHLAPPMRDFDAELPFLRYASLCWPIHLSRALSKPLSIHPLKRPPYLSLLAAFLADRKAVAAWAEASWRYNFPPNLSRLVPLLAEFESYADPAMVEEIAWVVQRLREVSAALNELKDEFGTALRGNPGLVWRWRGLAP